MTRTFAAIAALTVVSVALTLGFACALPLAAFATIAALAFPLGAAVGATLAVWAANQAVGFGLLHYPTDPATLEWGAGLGVIALASLAAARATLSARLGLAGVAAAFLAAFVAYEGGVYVGCVLAGDGMSSFAAHVVERIFVINAASFGALLALRELAGERRPGGAAPWTPARS